MTPPLKLVPRPGSAGGVGASKANARLDTTAEAVTTVAPPIASFFSASLRSTGRPSATSDPRGADHCHVLDPSATPRSANRRARWETKTAARSPHVRSTIESYGRIVVVPWLEHRLRMRWSAVSAGCSWQSATTASSTASRFTVLRPDQAPRAGDRGTRPSWSIVSATKPSGPACTEDSSRGRRASLADQCHTEPTLDGSAE